MAMLTVLERFLDAIASWYAHSILLCKSCTFFFAIENYIYNFVLVSRERFPMYGELKLAFFIYLWSPKTQVIRKQQTLSGKYKKQKQSDHICNWQLWF